MGMPGRFRVSKDYQRRPHEADAIVRLKNREFYVPDGFYLVKDENDQWSTLSPSLYELIKDKVHGEK